MIPFSIVNPIRAEYKQTSTWFPLIRESIIILSLLSYKPRKRKKVTDVEEIERKSARISCFYFRYIAREEEEAAINTGGPSHEFPLYIYIYIHRNIDLHVYEGGTAEIS